MSFLNRKREAEKAAAEMVSSTRHHLSTPTPMADVVPRTFVAVCGKVTRMTARPTTGQPALAVSIADETGTVTAVWTGRRSIGGVSLGRRIQIEGVPALHGAHLEFTNPGYTLLARQD
jgi:hypothetical protein